jgi:hypothetical protein
MSSTKIVKKTKVAAAKTAKKKQAKKTVKAKMVYWDELTPKQQAAYKKGRARAEAKARKDIEGGGKTLLRTTKDGWKIYAANDPLELRITQQCINKAMCGNKENCVVAQAIGRSQAFATDWMVGTNITIITCETTKEVIKYGTSAPLARAIPKFDTDSEWNLIPGTYRLNPLPVVYRIGNRWIMVKNKGKGTGGKRSFFKGTKRAPTRSGTMYQAIRKKAG